MKKYEIGIIGAGASGIMAAITAGRRGKSVILIEKNPVIGRKILATGNGRCNITNKNIKIENYHGGDPQFIANILKQFTQDETIHFFEEMGLVLKEEDNGRIFPRNNQASSVNKVLEFEMKRLEIEVKTEANVTDIKHLKGWQITLENGESIEVDRLILTTGGKAAQHLGSTGDGIYFSERMGHKIVPLFPSLVPIETIEKWPKEIQGLKITANVEMQVDDKIISSKSGDLLFTHYGVSGPAVMAQAGKIAPFIDNKPVRIIIDAYPEGTLSELDDKIKKIFDLNGAKSAKNALSGLAPHNLVYTLLKNMGISGERKSAQITKEERRQIANGFKTIILTVKSLRPFKEAQVTAGGISTGELEPTLKSKIVPDLYFAGEMIDVDADSGGFNLQWAWSSGFVAGKMYNYI